MLSKSDCLSILVKMEDNGINIDQWMKKLVVAKNIPLDVLQFIAKNRGIEVINFYEMLRKKHNQKKSSLYINILKGEDATQDAITTLTCLLVQIILYSNKLTDTKDAFLKEVRVEESTRALNEYFVNKDINTCLAVLRLIKTDLLVLEGISGQREFE